jgi:hypothetical protein
MASASEAGRRRSTRPTGDLPEATRALVDVGRPAYDDGGGGAPGCRTRSPAQSRQRQPPWPGGRNAPSDAGGRGRDSGAASYLFKRRRRELSEHDVAVIGTYQRRSGGHQTVRRRRLETLPGDAESRPITNSGGRKPIQDDPFGEAFGSTEVLSGQRPPSTNSGGDFRPNSTVAWGAGPDAAPPSRGGANFGAASGRTAGFGESGAFQTDDDPFASFGSTKLDDDPFAQNPFGQKPAATGAAGFGVDNPFDAADFSSAGGGGAKTAASAALDFSDLGEDAPAPMPAATDGGKGARSSKGGGFLDGLGSRSGGSARPGTAPAAQASAAAFDLDVGGGHDEATVIGAPAAGKGDKKGGGRRRRANAGRAGKSSTGRKLALGGLVVVIIGGVGLGQTDYGYFGDRRAARFGIGASERPIISERHAGSSRPRGCDKAAVASRCPATRRRTTAARIVELESQLAVAPTDVKLREELVRTLMRVQERYPTVYESKPSYGALAPEAAHARPAQRRQAAAHLQAPG